MLVHHDHIWYVLTKLNKHNKAWKKTTYTTEQCSACHSSFWYLEVFLTVDPCVYMKYSWKIERATNTEQTKHTHTTEQSVLCIIIYWHSTWRHLHRIKYLQFQMLFFLLHQNNRNKQTNNSKNNNDIFFFLLLLIHAFEFSLVIPTVIRCWVFSSYF